MCIRTVIVEDDPMVSNINKSFLERSHSFSLVGIARNGEEALQLFAKEPIDLLLLDMYMPSLNGMELLHKIRAEGIKSDVIMITAADSPEVIEEAMRLGVVDFILKPYDYNRFQSALQQFRKRYKIFRSQQKISQEGIDSLHGSDYKEKADIEQEFLPKGIDKITLHLIRETLENSGTPLSAQNISDQVRLSRITTRKYLEYLAETGEIVLDLKYSAQGRPTKLYHYLKKSL
jgi:response regulator of citrate/malate metabolism